MLAQNHNPFLYKVLCNLASFSLKHLLVCQGLSLSQSGGITFIDALQSGLGLQGRGVGEVEELLLKAINEAKAMSTRILLVLDGIDFLLAATETTVDDLLDSILELREVCHPHFCSSGVMFNPLRSQSRYSTGC